MTSLKKLRLVKFFIRRKIYFIDVALIIFLICLTTSITFAAERIENIETEVTSENFLPSLVKDRMEESIKAISQQLILGHTLPLNDQWKQSQEKIIHTVFDKILVGYTVNRVSIQMKDSTAIIKVNLLAWSDTIKQIQVKANVEGMPDELEELVINDLAAIDEVFNDCLKGLPIAATDWTNGILKRRLNNFMEKNLPEFRPDFDIKIKTENNISTAVIDLTVYPKLPVVRIISLSMLSNTIPNVALVTHRTLMEDKINVLIGVPVAFIDRHKNEIENMIAKPLDEQKDFRALKIKSEVSISTAEQMYIVIRSDSTLYKMRASGWVDLGRDSKAKDDILFRLHIGRKISNIDEGFFQMDVAPQTMTWNLSTGYSRNIFKNFNSSLRYDFTDKYFIADFEYEFYKDWIARYEHKLNNDRKEAAIRYKIHDFLSVEYVINHHENWLRFIGNF